LGVKAGASEAVVATVPHQHMFGLEASVMLPVMHGLVMHAGRPLFPADIRDALAEVEGTRILVTTPLHLRACVTESLRVPPVGLILSATAPLSRSLAQEAERHFQTEVHEIFGFAEAGSVAERRTVAGDHWRLLDGVRLVRDQQSQQGPQDQQGQIAWKAQASYLPAPVRVPDRITVDAESRFIVHGREADQVNIAGHRVSLGDLNQKLLDIDGVQDGVFFLPDEGAEFVTRLMACAVAPGKTVEELQQALRTRIDPVFLPPSAAAGAAAASQRDGEVTARGLVETCCAAGARRRDAAWRMSVSSRSARIIRLCPVTSRPSGRAWRAGNGRSHRDAAGTIRAGFGRYRAAVDQVVVAAVAGRTADDRHRTGGCRYRCVYLPSRSADRGCGVDSVSTSRREPDARAMSLAWKQQQERGSRLAIRFMAWVAQALGRPAARVLLYPICLYYLVVSRQANGALRRYYQQLQRRPAGWPALFRHYHSFASTLLDRVFFLRGRFGLFDIRMHGLEGLDKVLADGRGCLLLGSHLGSFEVVRAVGLSRQQIAVKVLMDEQNAPLIRALIQELNPAVAETVIQVGEVGTMLQVQECLTHGGVVGIMGDRLMMDGQSVRCEFLGGAADFPSGSIRLAHAVRAPVVLFFGLYRGGNRYDIHLELLSESIQLSADHRQDDVRRWTQRYADRLAHYSREAPDNWFNFYDFWQTSS
jgi:predicted LPLAT superfamily acyltransferase